MNDILFGVLQAVIVAAVAAIARYLIPYIRERLAATRYAWLVDVIDAAVRGAEQMIGPGHGSEKKAQAAEFISRWLETHHIRITEDQVNQLIEAAVQAMSAEQFKDLREDDGK